MPKVSQQHMDARRAQILDAARRCFLRDGFHPTSMQDLFAEAGLSAGAVYRHFTGKDEMILAIAEENMRDVLALMRTKAAGGGHRRRSAGAVMGDLLDVLRARSAERGLAGIAVLVWAEALRDPALARRLEELMTGMRTDLATLVSEHQERGELPAGVAPEAIASVLVCLLPGYLLQLALPGGDGAHDTDGTDGAHGVPDAVAGVPDAVRALWPEPAGG